MCDCNDAVIYVKATITVSRTGKAATPDDRNKNVIFTNCATFINWISEVNNTQVYDAHDIDVVMPMYNLME